MNYFSTSSIVTNNVSTTTLTNNYYSTTSIITNYFSTTTTAINPDNLTYDNASSDEAVLSYEGTGDAFSWMTSDGSGVCAAGSVCMGGHTHDVANLTWDNDWMIAYSNGSGLVELPLNTGQGKFLMSNGEAAPSWQTPSGLTGSWIVSGTNMYATTTVTTIGVGTTTPASIL